MAIYAGGYPLGFCITQEKQPRIDQNRPRGLTFQSRSSVESLDHGVRLFYYAPEAKHVAVEIWGEKKQRTMLPTDLQGYWAADITDKAGGMYCYDVYVDGVLALDTRGNIVFSTRATNSFEIPEKDFDLYYMKDVPHGAIQMRYFYSAESHAMRCVLIYTPPGYDLSMKRYPTLYLQHGGGENEGGWLWCGRANFILDNLIAAGKCRPMLVIMNDGYVLEKDGDMCTTGSIARMISQDCVPYIDREFRTIPERMYRAVAGLSQGGLHARSIAFENSALFAHLGMFSSGVGFEVDSCDIWGRRHDYRTLFTSPEHYADLFHTTFITCGTEDPRNCYIKPQVEALQAQGYAIRYAAYPGAHEWQVWRKSLCDFLPQLF